MSLGILDRNLQLKGPLVIRNICKQLRTKAIGNPEDRIIRLLPFKWHLYKHSVP